MGSQPTEPSHPLGKDNLKRMDQLPESILKYALVLLASSIQSGCRAKDTPAEVISGGEIVGPEVVELDRRQWKIGDLDAETLFFLEDGIPQHSTTVTNNNATDRWWTGLTVYGYRASGSIPPVNTDPISDAAWEALTEEELNLRLGGGWGSGGGQACRSSSSLPEIIKGTVQMRPGETRSYQASHTNYPPSPRRETVTSWSLKGQAALPSDQPFEEWPPFEVSLTFRWDKEDGCSVDSRAL